MSILKTDGPGRFGPFGGQFVPETLIPCLEELEEARQAAAADPAFATDLELLLADYAGRPTPLYRAQRLEQAWSHGKARIYLKREDLNHTGSHKINNCLGQILLAGRMGKGRIVAETGAGQHGVAAATVCALAGLECTIYMGATDVERQALNVARMKLLGAEIRIVTNGSATLKDATSEAIRDWVTNVTDTHYIIGSTVGPHPYPTLVRDFQAVIGREARDQVLIKEGRLPDRIIACVGGGSNAIGIFSGFVDDTGVELFGVEAAGSDLGHSEALGRGRPGVLHGSYSYLVQDDDGQVIPAHSIAAGLDYPGVGPEHSHLRDTGRATYLGVGDGAALATCAEVSRLEGIIPALESSHALAFCKQQLADSGQDKPLVIVNLSGRGDKDMAGLEEVSP